MGGELDPSTLRDFEAARGDTTLNADVVVVGSGPGGAALSRALADRGMKVVVLEEGPSTPRFRPNLAHTYRYHMQEDGAMVARGSGFMPIAAGRGVGGGSLVNSAIALRTPATVLDGWSTLMGGDGRLSRAALDPVYDELEALLGVGVTSAEISGENNAIIVRGAAKLGFPGGLVPRNAPGCVGCSLCNNGCPSGGKASVDRNLIPMARANGAIVQGDVKIDTILVEGGRAVGVSGDVHDTDTREKVGRITVRAPKVFLSAGAVGTPRLLHHCGLASTLGDRVGKGLHVHPGNAVLGLCDTDVHMWKGATQGAYFEDPALPGVLPHTFNAPPGAVLVLLGKIGHDNKAFLPNLKRVCGSVVMVSDHGEGTVGATKEGRADLHYWFDPGDLDRVKAGMVSTARVLLAGGAKQVIGLAHGVGWHSDADEFAAALAPRALEDFQLYASHPMATCRMGADPAASVVGIDGQTHGLPGLYIADASVFPTSLGVNPQLTTMAVATVIGRNLAI
jgi:choline dehydrogenase-like flavoprotein